MCVCIGCGGKGCGLKDRLTECFCILVVAGDTFSEEEESLSVKCAGRRVTHLQLRERGEEGDRSPGGSPTTFHPLGSPPGLHVCVPKWTSS